MAHNSNKHLKKPVRRPISVMVFAGIVLLGGITILAITALNTSAFGRWSIALFLFGASLCCSALFTMKTGDPSWIMLYQLLLPE